MINFLVSIYLSIINFLVSIPLSLWIPFYSSTGVFIYLAIKKLKSSYNTIRNGIIPEIYIGGLTVKEALSLTMKIKTINWSAKLMVVSVSVVTDFLMNLAIYSIFLCVFLIFLGLPFIALPFQSFTVPLLTNIICFLSAFSLLTVKEEKIRKFLAGQETIKKSFEKEEKIPDQEAKIEVLSDKEITP